jgi:mannosyltransferase OCH1-like enzyme
MLIRLLVLLCFFSTLVQAQNNNILDVDFMQSMTDGNPEGRKFLTSDPKRSNYLKILHDNYEAKKPSKMPYSPTPLIPKVMHQIWDGDVPPLYQNYLDECRKLHPDWEFKIWGDKEIDALNMEYRNLYDKVRSYAAKADVLRYEFLYRLGGVYRDMDVKCLVPIDDLVHKYDFFIAAEGPFVFKYPVLNNGIIGAAPKSKIFKNTLEFMDNNIDKNLQNWDLDYKNNEIHAFAVDNTMVPLTHEVLDNLSLDDKIIVLPPSYFIPIRVDNHKYSRIHRKRKIFEYYIDDCFYSFKPETVMWHNDGKVDISFARSKILKWGSIYDNGVEVIKKLSPDQHKIFNLFEKVHNTNFQNVKLNKVSKIPLMLNFIVFDQDEVSVLNNNLSGWKRLNANFEISVWDKAKIFKEFPELANLDVNSENLRFLIGLKVIEKFGGHYADFRAIAHKPIFELGNKYNFYAGMMPVTKLTSKIFLSHKLIGANAHHPIFIKTLSQIDISSIESVNKLDEVLTLEVYKNIYLDGQNIILPAIYFEPIYHYDESFVDKVIRFVKRLPKPFLQITRYSVIE